MTISIPVMSFHPTKEKPLHIYAGNFDNISSLKTAGGIIFFVGMFLLWGGFALYVSQTIIDFKNKSIKHGFGIIKQLF